jgi:hypothetical protein
MTWSMSWTVQLPCDFSSRKAAIALYEFVLESDIAFLDMFRVCGRPVSESISASQSADALL